MSPFGTLARRWKAAAYRRLCGVWAIIYLAALAAGRSAPIAILPPQFRVDPYKA